MAFSIDPLPNHPWIGKQAVVHATKGGMINRPRPERRGTVDAARVITTCNAETIVDIFVAGEWEDSRNKITLV